MNTEGVISPSRAIVKTENGKYEVTIEVGQSSVDGHRIRVNMGIRELSHEGKTYKMSGDAIL